VIVRKTKPGPPESDSFWCVLIALETGGEAVLGVAHFPMRAETYWGARGSGSYRNGERLRVSAVERTSEAVVSPDGRRERDGEGMTAFLSRFRAVRSPGGALEAALLAAGQIDVWFERRAAVWDLAPLQVIIEEAGGRFFALDGTRRIDGGNAVACTPALEREVREFFGLG
jgi:histidinol-phosphatase